MSTVAYTLTVPATAAGMRADSWLVQAVPALSRARIQGLISAGLVTLDGRLLKSSARLVADQTLHLTLPPPEPVVPQPEDLPLNIVYEDADILVLDKPAGLVVHPAPGHATGTLVNAVLHHYGDLGGVGDVERPGIVHRLDKETTGLMVVAKTEVALTGLIAQFKSQSIGKVYFALVHGIPNPASGTIDTLIGRHPRQRKRMAVVSSNGKQAVTHYTVSRRFCDMSLVEAHIVTGRTHQIRVHLAHLGHPLAGDSLYGCRSRDRTLPDPPARQMLHAAKLTFAHPVSAAPLAFFCEPPADMRRLLERLATATPPETL